MAQVKVLEDAEAVAREAADQVAAFVAGGGGSLVLTGGTTPRRLYEILAAREDLEWGRVTVLFGDERCVPPTDPESNYRLAFETLLSKVHPASVHRMAAELGAEEGAQRYDSIVAAIAPLDLVLLGIGEDGHTASLFPGHPEPSAGGYAIPVHNSPKPPPDRVSLTLRALQGAHRVLVLATGAGKADAVRLAREHKVPAGMIAGATFLCDRAAAGEA